MKSNFQKVLEFHEKFNCYTRGYPGYIGTDRELLRVRLIASEFGELTDAMGEKDLVKIADALGDLLYVVYGAGHAYGIDLDTVFEEIHTSNMTKSNETDAGGKITKGPHFVPPDIEKVLDKQIRERA